MKCLTSHLTQSQPPKHFLKCKVLNVVSSPLCRPLAGLPTVPRPGRRGSTEPAPRCHLPPGSSGERPPGDRSGCVGRGLPAPLSVVLNTLSILWEVTCASDLEPSTTLTRSLPPWDSPARGGLWEETKLRVDSSSQPFTHSLSKCLQ